MDIIKEIIRQFTDLPINEIDENMSLQGDIGLDSFSMISMLVELENAFNVEIPNQELQNFQTLTDLCNYVTTAAN